MTRKPKSLARDAHARHLATTRILLVTGMSGAGKSSVLDILEDVGWEVVDNLPLILLNQLIDISAGDSPKRGDALAVCIDSRTRDFRPQALVAEIGRLRRRGDLAVTLIFIDCENDILQNRFTTTRRRHPLAADRPVVDGIRRERELIIDLRDHADLTVDTTALSPPDIRRLIAANYTLDVDPGLHLLVTSFSYLRGLPRDADLVFDVRFFRNPFYQPALKARSGHDEAVAAFISGDEAWQGFRTGLIGLLRTLLPHYQREGQRYLTIAIGCTGGRHRSVFVAESVARWLADDDHQVTLRHRDIDSPTK